MLTITERRINYQFLKLDFFFKIPRIMKLVASGLKKKEKSVTPKMTKLEPAALLCVIFSVAIVNLRSLEDYKFKGHLLCTPPSPQGSP